MMDDTIALFKKTYLGKDTHQTLESIYLWMMGLSGILTLFSFLILFIFLFLLQ